MSGGKILVQLTWEHTDFDVKTGLYKLDLPSKGGQMRTLPGFQRFPSGFFLFIDSIMGAEIADPHPDSTRFRTEY